VTFKQNQVNAHILIFHNFTHLSPILATIVTVHDPYNFSTTRYHLEERLVTKEDDQEVNKNSFF
jgi:hypothetical protein